MIDESDLKCPICKCIHEDVSFLTSCGHEFCDSCIRQWIGNPNNNPSCPICRRTATLGAIKPCRVLRKIIQKIRLEQSHELSPESSQFEVDEDTAARLKRILCAGDPEDLLKEIEDEAEDEDKEEVQFLVCHWKTLASKGP